MADAKITELIEETALENTDLVPVVVEVSSTPVTKKVTWTTIKSFLKTCFDTLYSSLSGNNSFTGTTTMVGRLLVPMGEIGYFSLTGTMISISAQSNGSTNMVVVNPASTLDADSYEFDNGGADSGRLRYTGATTKMFHIACTISLAAAAANDTFVFAIAKNGIVDPLTRILYRTINAGDTRSTALHGMIELATNDYLELYVGNTTDADDLTIKTINLVTVGM